MAKKCIPGLFCIENMTLFVLILILLLLIYFYYKYFVSYVYNLAFQDVHKLLKQNNQQVIPAPSFIVSSGGHSHYSPPIQHNLSSLIHHHNDPIHDVYSPPLTMDDSIYPTSKLMKDIYSVRGLPINISTNSSPSEYRQLGILTKNAKGGNPLILPLMGRSLRNGRDKWQYYTMANTAGAAINTKLPVSVNGRSCSGEYGCDNISNGDTVYVEGFNDTFKVTIYENGLLSYIPFL